VYLTCVAENADGFMTRLPYRRALEGELGGYQRTGVTQLLRTEPAASEAVITRVDRVSGSGRAGQLTSSAPA
jgi:hypothetical protein